MALAAALVAGMSASAEAAGAAAPAAAEASDAGVGEIVVTARKVAERLQDVPVAITAFDGKTLEARQAVELGDVARIAPGLTILTQTINGASNAFFTLRGQTQRSNLATVDPSVGVYVDGVYWARSYGINVNLLDVGDLQVLRGPQGTLFGRNTTGGAILINTNNPKLDALEGRFSVSYGRFDYKMGTAVINAPIVADKLAARLAFQVINDGGYVHNINYPNQKFGNQNNYTMRTKLLAQFSDNTSLLLSADIFREDHRPDTGELRFVPAANTNTFLDAGAQTLGAGTCFVNIPGCIAQGKTTINNILGRYASLGKDGRQVGGNIANQSLTHTDTYTATLNQATPLGDVKVIGGYRKVYSTFYGDYDGSEIGLMDYSGLQKFHQWSVEATLTGKALNDRLSYAGGLFYFTERGRDKSDFAALSAINPLITRYDGRIDNKSIGVYGQASYKITDELSLTGGLRWSQDKKAVTIYNGNASGTIFNAKPDVVTGPYAGGGLGCVVSSGCPTTYDGKFDGVSWTADLDYKVTPDILIYAKASHAFRSGGVNLRENTLIPGVPTSFKPEKVTSYEGGFKGDMLDHRVRLNLAGYYMVQRDSQREYTESSIVNGIPVNITIDVNAGRVDFWGGEGELTAVVLDTGSDKYSAVLNGSYTRPKYKSNNDVVTGFDRTRELIPFIPKWTASATGTYEHQFEASKLELSATYNWDSGFPFTEFNYYSEPGDPPGMVHNASNGSLMSAADAQSIKHLEHIHESGTLDLRAALDFGENDRYEVALWGRNVLNNRNFVFSNTVTAIAISSARRPPATYGITGSVKF
jgi:iron complex outermembrane receptor protein